MKRKDALDIIRVRQYSFLTLTFVFLCGSANVRAQVADNQALYKQLQGAIFALVTGRAPDAPASSTDPVIQIVAAPLSAEWASPEFGQYNAATIADHVPNVSELYNPSSETLYDDYYKFLRAIRLPPGPTDAELAKIEKLRLASDAALQEWQTTRAKDKDRYQKEEVASKKGTTDKPIKFTAWLTQENENERLAGLKSKRNILDGKYFAELQQAYHGNDLIINDIATARATPISMIDEFGNPFDMAPASIAPSLAVFLKAADAADVANPAHLHTIWEISKSSRSRDFSTRSFSGSASGGFGFIRFSGGGGYTSTSLNTASDAFKLTIEFSAWQQFVVSRPWFKRSYFRDYSDDSQFDFGPQKLWNANPHTILFGDKGRLRYAIQSFIVVYKPTITVTLDHSDYVSLKTSWQANVGGSWGPFSVGASGSGTDEHEKWNDASNTVSLSSATATPQIIAVTLEALP